MDNAQWFILGILVLIVLNHAHRRHVRAGLIRYLQDDNKSAQDIKVIMKAYEGEE